MFGSWFRQRRVYLDYAAATPTRPEVVVAMKPYLTSSFANPGGIHQEGVQARRAVEEARAEVATTCGVRPEDVYFTASGTESNNLAIMGTVAHYEAQGVPLSEIEIISTPIEHPATLGALAHLARRGVRITYVAIDEYGHIDLVDLKTKLSPQTRLVTCSYVNSEVGTVERVGKVARAVRAHERTHGARITLHVDAAQAPLWLPCDLPKLGANLVSFDAGKCYGPKGVGMLVARHGTLLLPIMYGGGQERGLRPGTENVPGIVGAARAFVIAQSAWKARAAGARPLRDLLITELLTIDGAVLNGAPHTSEDRVANNVNISIPGIDSEFVVITLDEAGVAAATKSACGSGRGQGSSVVRAMTGDEARAISTLRFTLGEATTRDDVLRTSSLLKTHVTRTQTHFPKNIDKSNY